MDALKNGIEEGRRTNLLHAFNGIFFAVVHYWPKIWACLKTCDTVFQKVESILALVAITFGFAKPGHLIFKVLKHLMTSVTVKVVGRKIPVPQYLENILESGTMFMSQLGLTEVWDRCRETISCMQDYTCEDDLGVFLTNKKSWICGSKEVPEPGSGSTYNNKLSTTCEKVMNESPLILLVLFIGFLYFMQMIQTTEEVESGDESTGKVDPNADGTRSGNDQASGDTPPTGDTTPPATTSQPSSDAPGPGTQLVDAECPTCKTAHVALIPLPSPKICRDCTHSSPPKKFLSTSTSDPIPTGSQTRTDLAGGGDSDDDDDDSDDDCSNDDEAAIERAVKAAVYKQVTAAVAELSKQVNPGCQRRLQRLLESEFPNGGGGSGGGGNSGNGDAGQVDPSCKTCGHVHD